MRFRLSLHDQVNFRVCDVAVTADAESSVADVHRAVSLAVPIHGEPAVNGALLDGSRSRASELFLVFMVVSPISLVGTSVVDRRRKRRRNATARASYQEQLAIAMADLERLRTTELARRRNDLPDPAETYAAASGPGRRVWERRPSDDDFLVVRVGETTMPSNIVLDGGDAADANPPFATAPIGVPLRTVGVAGVAGRREPARAIVRSMVMQLAAFHSPDDLRLVMLLADDSEAAWSWCRWLPHVRTDGPAEVAIGNDYDTVRARLAEVAELVNQRWQRRSGHERAAQFSPAVVVVIEDIHDLRQLGATATLLERGPEVGVYAICLDESDLTLPEETQGAVVFEPRPPLRRVGVSTRQRLQ
jgi:DNA segregation ATPase FtsK/SpoIIIE, S-DNA-T family